MRRRRSTAYRHAMGAARSSMLANFRRSDGWLAAAIFATVVRALLPQGLTLGSEEGAPVLLICTASGLQAADDDAGGAAPMQAGGVCHVTHTLGCAAGAQVFASSRIEWTIRQPKALEIAAPRMEQSRPQAARAPPDAHV